MPQKQKELQGITHHYILYSNHSFIYFISQIIMDLMVKGHRHSQTVTSEKWCSCVQNCTEHQSDTYTTMTVTKTNVTISTKRHLIGLSGI